jgi:hypothetical protein
MERFGKPFNPGEERRKKRNSFLSVVLFLICAVVVIAIATIIIEHLISSWVVPGQEETWAASVASYWGGIIGGVISGILAFLGVFYTIRYYKDSDAQKERAAVQPFLLVKVGQDNRPELSKGFGLGKVPEDEKKRKEVKVSIQNIGNGFATTLVIHTGANIGGLAFNKVIPVGEFAYTYFMVDPGNLKEGLHFEGSGQLCEKCFFELYPMPSTSDREGCARPTVQAREKQNNKE